MDRLIVFDDSYDVPANVSSFFGLDRFADLIIRRRSLRSRVDALSVLLGWGEPLVVDRGPVGAPALHRLERVLRRDGFAIYMPSCVTFGAQDSELREFVEKLSHSTRSVRVEKAPADAGTTAEGGTMLVLREGELRRFFDVVAEGVSPAEMARLAAELPPVPDDAGMKDLRDPVQFLDAVTSTFDVRHFNVVSAADRYTLVKRSNDPEKLAREHAYFTYLPERMRRFFVQPFDFRREGGVASYRMERLLVPDVALQWLHHAFGPPPFEQFLDRVFHFLQERVRREVGPGEGRRIADALYVDKVRERVGRLEGLAPFHAIEGHCRSAFGGVRALLDRYLELYAALGRRRDHTTLVVGHGDLCFSNILYDGVFGILKLVDPRGAASAAELYSDPWYDVAKLSHSIEGGYDFVNAGLFGIELDDAGVPQLRTDCPAHRVEVAAFRRRCRALGFEPRLVRLYEASLFISMTPLHIDAPRKVMAFLLTAARILDEVAVEARWREPK
jgi:hypothetical protein